MENLGWHVKMHRSLLALNAYNMPVYRLIYYFCQGGYVFVVFSVCLIV